MIYGVAGMMIEKQQNIEQALSFGIPHISSYALQWSQNGFEKLKPEK
jgi:coproporphyrinogen III oxidase-like Fe-S oxidoreductase